MTALIGEGGMGQVYRAHDTKLQRDVALKILPDAFVHDHDRVARFTREAQVLASLNHPNIGAIYGFEDSGDVHALVLELVEGATLADRIERGPLPVDDALAIARQIAEALEAAHEHGIVHRDLKPANIKVRDDGTVKVLDFGLAKPADVGRVVSSRRAGSAGSPEQDPAYARNFTQSPTIMSPAITGMGVILGTAAYMSPVQAKGKPADKRSDIWAFGCVLYEMLTGKRAFEGEDVSDTLAAVLRGEPDWVRLARNATPHIRDLVQSCLSKDRKQRLPDIAAARFLLDHEPPQTTPPTKLSARTAFAIGIALGRWIAFMWGGGELRKVPITGGPPVPITQTGVLNGASWGSDNTIVFSIRTDAGLFRVSADGGTPERLTTLDTQRGESQHGWPDVLPGARAVLYTVLFGPARDSSSNALIAALDLRTRQSAVLIRGGAQPRFVEPDHLVYLAGNSIMATRFDPDRLEVLGEPVHVVPVATKSSGVGEFGVSRNGTLAYAPTAVRSSQTGPLRSLVWVDRAGREEAVRGAPAAAYGYPRLSPDGTRVAVNRTDEIRAIWILDLARQTFNRLTSGQTEENSAVWTDRETIVFGSQRSGASNLFQQRVDTTGGAEHLTTHGSNQVPTSVSPGGEVVMWQVAAGGDLDLVAVDSAGRGPTRPLVATSAVETNGDVSPDGRWLAYESNASGELHVFVQPFGSAEGARVQISTSGGRQPRWAPSGRELFFINERGELMGVPVQTGTTFTAGTPTRVLDAKYFNDRGSTRNARNYDVARDGRFLVIKGSGDEEDARPDRLVVVVNWREELKASLGSK